MNGVLHIRMRQNGRILIKMFSLIVIFTITLSGCSLLDWFVGDGRGDWANEIYNGYYITKVNSRGISFTYKENPNQTGSSFVIEPNYYVVGYQTHKPYIGIIGLHTQDSFISDDELDKLHKLKLSCYLVNTETGEVNGPFYSYQDFEVFCDSVSLKVSNKWKKANPDEKGIKLPTDGEYYIFENSETMERLEDKEQSEDKDQSGDAGLK